MKILLNSLYGKFAEHAEREELITNPDESIEGCYDYDDMFGYSVRKTTQYRAHQLLGIAARITTMSQLKLYEYIETIQRHGGKIYYCDTDSIVTDIRMPTSSNLGGIKKEYDIQEAVFLAPKTYCLKLYDDNKEKIVLKGFSHDFHKNINFETFKNALFKQDFRAFNEETIRPASFKTIHVRGFNGFVTMLQEKQIVSTYDKRKILSDFSTQPLTVPITENNL